MDTSARNIISDLLKVANLEMPFTDILMEHDSPFMLKMPNGWEEYWEVDPPSLDDMTKLLKAIDQNYEEELLKGAINRPFDLQNWRLRINAYLAFGGSKVMLSIRRIPRKPPQFKDTGLPYAVKLLMEAQRGLILISGSTGSGKSTTLASMIQSVNEVKNAHIITIEDPIEYVFTRDKAVFSQREVGVDTQSFYDGVWDAMRQRPDIIVVGEIRDRETAETAMLAGESGHLVIGTVHASTAVGTIQKILSFFPEDARLAKLQTLSGSLVGVISQILLPAADASGYVLAVELLANHKQQFSHLLGDISKLQSALERREDDVSITMNDCLVDLVSNNKVSKLEALRAVSGNPALSERLRALK